MVGELKRFELDLEKFADKLMLDITTVRRKLAFDLFGKIVFKTPVDEGRLRANWAMVEGSNSVPENVEEGQRTIGQADNEAKGRVQVAVTGGGKPFDFIVITNNLPYAEPIEFGHSQQAPAGMIRVSIAEVQAETEAVLRRL